MRTTVDIDDSVFANAAAYAPGLSKHDLIERALRDFAARGAQAELARLGGTLPDLDVNVPDRKKRVRA